MTTTILLIFVGALVLAVGATPLARLAAPRLGVMDQPSARKIHHTPIPRIGGIAMYLGVLVALLIFGDVFRIEQLAGILIGATWMSFMGLLDDRRGLRPIGKLIAQGLGAGLLIAIGIQVQFLPYTWLNWLVTVLWVVGITNAMNLLDNMDGLSGGVAAIASGFFLILAVENGQYLVSALSAALLGAAMGFLIYNFNPASIFMGDTGSLFIGFILAALGIKLRFSHLTDAVTWMIPLIILGLPIFDTALVTISRLRRRISPFTAGKDHTSHRLVNSGLNQREAVMSLHIVSFVLGMAAILLANSDFISAYVIGAAILLMGLYAMIWLEKDYHSPSGDMVKKT